MLLSRDEFRAAVFARDKNTCVVPGCGKPAQDAHHVMERRLWPDGGYYLANGASVCGEHHIACEQTLISTAEIREYAGIKEILLPEHLYTDQVYDKWANPVLPNGQRLKGELFHDESVQKAIKPVLHLFTNRVKYPRTFHLPWSPGTTNDDRIMADTSGFEGQEVVVTVKMDGEQTTMYRDGFHARSLDTPAHPSRDWLWGLHRRMGHDIPEGWRLCGENLYARHSIHYKNLPAHFLLFSIWNEKNVALAWDDMMVWAELLEIPVVPILYRGLWDEAVVQGLYRPEVAEDECEGYVARVARAFTYREFPSVVGKYVRKGHVVEHGGHWKSRPVLMNLLSSPDKKAEASL